MYIPKQTWEDWDWGHGHEGGDRERDEEGMPMLSKIVLYKLIAFAVIMCCVCACSRWFSARRDRDRQERAYLLQDSFNSSSGRSPQDYSSLAWGSSAGPYGVSTANTAYQMRTDPVPPAYSPISCCQEEGTAANPPQSTQIRPRPSPPPYHG
mmetsp:Transcript_4253/g.10798  ORF Transcript_4253/g.10798 Transcript_4253/m.10798 type:complete len:152 (+) Transcript_4253:33-488(+)